MSNYQAIYDAAFAQFDISWVLPRAIEAMGIVQNEMTRPSVLFKPRIYLDGNSWIALYGDNLQEGIVGIGDSPDLAAYDFDKAWCKKVAKEENKSA